MSFPPALHLLHLIPTPLPTPSTLTHPTLSALLALYAPLLTHVSPRKTITGRQPLTELDVLRYETLPARVRERRKAAGSQDGKEREDGEMAGAGWLEKGEVEQLVAWKLTRGKYHASLLLLVKTNTATSIIEITTEAFALFAVTPEDPFPALRKLAELRYVGPATASLLLSVAYPGDVPFFADEILGWLREGKEKAQAKLKYDWKEYEEVWEGVRGVKDAVEKGAGEGERVSAEDVERGGWVAEMVRGMGLENAAVAEKEDGSGVVKEGEGNEGLQAFDWNFTKKVRIEDEDNEIPSAKATGRQDNRASTRASTRQKRKIPSSISPPAATAKKSKKASKASKASERLQTGDGNVQEKVGIEDKNNDIPSAINAGRQDERASTRASTRQKRKIPPSISPPAATAKKSKKASKASKASERLQTGDGNVQEKVGIEDEDYDIPSAKDAGRQDNRASTRASTRQKRKIPPSVSLPAATAKKSKKAPKVSKASKASKASKRPQAGELATSRLPRDPADANEGDGSRRLPQRRRPPKASYRDETPRGPLQGASCAWGAALDTTMENYGPQRAIRRGYYPWTGCMAR